MDSRDIALQSVLPTVMVPRFSEFEELSQAGQRLLMASNGIWLEVKRAWMYSRVQVSLPLGVHVPYGTMSDITRFAFGKLPKVLVSQFIEIAKTRNPNECAAWIIWNAETKEWRLQMLEEISAGVGHVKVILPALAENEHMIVDIHSHGGIRAFFSSTDNEDDKGEVKISGVVGNLNTSGTSAFRLCINGVFLPLSSPLGQEEI